MIAPHSRSADDLLDEAAVQRAFAANSRESGHFRRSQAPVGPDLALKSQMFFADLNHGDKSALTTEERACGTSAPALLRRSARRGGAQALRQIHPARAAPRLAAQEWVTARPFENWTLGELAGSVGSSPYHLLRLFRAETGSTIHQYRMQLRLTAAARHDSGWL